MIEKIDGLEQSFNVDELISKYTPSDEQCEVLMPGGEVLKFKTPPDKASLDAHLRAGAHWYSKLPNPKSEEAKTHNFAGVLPANSGDAILAYSIAAWSVEPKFTQRQALTMLKAPWMASYIMKTLEAHMKTMESLFSLRLLEESKKNLETLGGESK